MPYRYDIPNLRANYSFDIREFATLNEIARKQIQQDLESMASIRTAVINDDMRFRTRQGDTYVAKTPKHLDDEAIDNAHVHVTNSAGREVRYKPNAFEGIKIYCQAPCYAVSSSARIAEYAAKRRESGLSEPFKISVSSLADGLEGTFIALEVWFKDLVKKNERLNREMDLFDTISALKEREKRTRMGLNLNPVAQPTC